MELAQAVIPVQHPADVRPVGVIEDELQALFQARLPTTAKAFEDFKVKAGNLRQSIQMLGVLAVALGKAAGDLKKHLQLCKKASEAAERKEQQEKDRLEAEKARHSAMQKAEEVRQRQVAPTTLKVKGGEHERTSREWLDGKETKRDAHSHGQICAP